MKKRIIFLMIAVLAVSFSSTGFAAAKKKTAKQKKAAPVVLAKGLQISWCGVDVKDNGSVTILDLNGVTLPVKKGKFDLVLPAAPVFGENQQNETPELDFGTAKVYPFSVIFFGNKKKGDNVAMGRGFLGFKIFYSDSNVNGTVNGEPVTLKKGWNIVGDKTDLTVALMCAG